MIVIRVAFEINPAERAGMLTYLQQHIAETRRDFAGCLNYGFYQDATNENGFLLYEEWDNQANFDAFKNSQAFQENGKVLFPLMVGKPDSVYYAATAMN
jgi:quinol monooxygenase YgiN